VIKFNGKRRRGLWKIKEGGSPRADVPQNFNDFAEREGMRPKEDCRASEDVLFPSCSKL
jgi:hypothetical protein